MKRNPRKVRWTKAFRRSAGKEMAIDSSLEFEKRRNIPIRYNRELMQTTIKAIHHVTEIKEKRKRQFYINRMDTNNTKDTIKNTKEIEQNINLLLPKKKKVTIREEKLPAVAVQDVEMMEN